MATVLIPLAQGCEELEAVTLIDLLRRAGVTVVVAGLEQGAVTASRGVVLLPEVTLDAVLDRDFDLVVLPGGLGGAQRLEADQRIATLLRLSLIHIYPPLKGRPGADVLSQSSRNKQSTPFTKRHPPGRWSFVDSSAPSRYHPTLDSPPATPSQLGYDRQPCFPQRSTLSLRRRLCDQSPNSIMRRLSSYLGRN